MTEARLELNEYSTRVLDVVKGKFGLKNRSEALNRFIKEYGNDFVEPIVNEEHLNKIDLIYEDHIKKHKNRSMTLKELNSLLELDE